MEEVTFEECIEAWKNQVPPPVDELTKYNSVLYFMFEGEKWYASVWWDNCGQSYAFHPLNKTGDSQFIWRDIACMDRHDQLVDLITNLFGPVSIYGIHKNFYVTAIMGHLSYVN